MGLDMHLEVADENDDLHEVAYWRKVNALHNWFVKNVQGGVDDCGDYEVTPKHLEALKDVVNKVLTDRTLAPKLFPTVSGFFFGDTSYGEWYWADLEDLKKTLDGLDPNQTYWYHSSW